MMQMRKRHNKEKVFIILWYMFYSLMGIISKYNAMTSEFKSLRFFMLLGVQLFGFAVFTVGWQVILRRFELSYAYLFKGTTVLWSMFFASVVFNEVITYNNILGGTIIIIGIGVILYE